MRYPHLFINQLKKNNDYIVIYIWKKDSYYNSILIITKTIAIKLLSRAIKQK